VNGNPQGSPITAPARFGLLLVALLPVLLLGACTVRPELADPPRYALALRTAERPLPGDSVVRRSLLDSGLSFAAPASLLNYDARYSLQPPASLPGFDAADQVGERAGEQADALTGAPAPLLGGESFRQSLRIQLPFLFEQPLLISAEDRYRGLLTPEARASSRSAQLQWSPAALALGLRWAPGSALAPALPLRCQLSGSIELPGAVLTGRSGDGLKLQGQDCRVIVPQRGAAGVEVGRYSATWQWQRKRSNSSVHLLVLEAPEGLNTGTRVAARTPGYEFGASRAQKAGKLTADSSLALRRAGNQSGSREPFDWAARASLRRQFTDLLLSASLQREADPLWFLPNDTAGASVNSIELGIEFDRWIARQLATRHVGLGLVGRWAEPPTPDQAYDYRVLWNFSLRP